MWMTRDLVTIEPHTPVVDAAALMAAKHIRRLPVVERRADGLHLLGIISAKDILHAFPPDVNPFAVAAPDAGFSPVMAAQIMSRRLHTTTPDTPIEEAARLMAEMKIGSLPVTREGMLVGLITESDIFRAFVTFFSAPERGARISFDMSKGEDVFGFIIRAARQWQLRVTSLISSRQHDVPVCVVRVTGKAIEEFLDELWRSGHRVLNVIRFN
jgi:acetoin utilization protein AcuB